MVRGVVVVAATLALVGGASAPGVVRADWPMHLRGAYHQAWNQVEKTLTPATVAGLRAAWTVQLRLDGQPPFRFTGSASVVGDRIYVGGLSVSARSASTGQLVWSRQLGAGVENAPAVADGLVVVATRTTGSRGRVVALDAATGEVRWERRLPASTFTAPTVVGDLVYVSAGSVHALRLHTGAVAWTWTPPPLHNAYLGSPATDGDRVYVAYNAGNVVFALDGATGVPQWQRYTGDGNGSGFDLAVSGGRVFGVNGKGRAFALDAGTGAILWKRALGILQLPVTAVPEAVVVPVGSPGNVLAALSPATGAVLWIYANGTPEGARALAAAGGLVYTSGRDDQGVFLDAVRLSDGSRVTRVRVAEEFTPTWPWSSEGVSVSRGAVYLPVLTTLTRFDLAP